MGVILIADRKELIPHEGHVIHQDNARETPPISTCIYQVYAIRHEAVHDLEHATISDAANFATQDEKEAYNAGVSLFYEHLHDEPSHIPTIGDTNGKRPKMSCALCDDMTKDCRNVSYPFFSSPVINEFYQKSTTYMLDINT